jgi:hypothetical protein
MCFEDRIARKSLIQLLPRHTVLAASNHWLYAGWGGRLNSAVSIHPHEKPSLTIQQIKIRGARTHNLKNISVDLPRDKLIVITGLSGSGKSSLAFDTLYAEGQRRYVESLSAYARQFLSMMDKPDVDSIEGLSPAIAIEQKATSHNPRSTVGTVTEIYDYLRLLFARAGIARCPDHGIDLAAQTVSQMVDQIVKMPEGLAVLLLAPIVIDRARRWTYCLQNWIPPLLRPGSPPLQRNGMTKNLSSMSPASSSSIGSTPTIYHRCAMRLRLPQAPL